MINQSDPVPPGFIPPSTFAPQTESDGTLPQTDGTLPQTDGALPQTDGAVPLKVSGLMGWITVLMLALLAAFYY